jgi:hypothetical protein
VCADCILSKHNKHNLESLFDERITYLISEGIGLKFKSDIIFLDFVAVVNIVLPWIDFKAAMISSWWSIAISRCTTENNNEQYPVYRT